MFLFRQNERRRWPTSREARNYLLPYSIVGAQSGNQGVHHSSGTSFTS